MKKQRLSLPTLSTLPTRTNRSRLRFGPTLLLLTLASSLVAAQTRGQAPNLFEFLDAGDVQLTEDQTGRLQAFEEDPTAGDVQLVLIDLGLADMADSMNLNLIPGHEIPLTTTRRDERKAGDYSWFAEDRDSGSSAMLVVQGDEIVGTVRSSGQLFQVRPLGDGIHAVIEVEQDKLPPDHPEEYDELDPQQMDPGPAGDQGDAAMADACSPIDVIVAYTPVAEAQAGNIGGLIQLAIDETNLSYANSAIQPRLNLVHSYETNYTESGSMSQDRDRFRIVGDGHMDEIHGLRDTHGADVAVLVTGRGGFCGIAADIGAVASTAFAVVGQNCATGYYSFGHEIGHLQGARHNPEADPTPTPFPFGHGLFHAPDSWRTVMSYNCPGGCTRVTQWSNPDVDYQGTPTGTVAGNDNARVLDETACTIAGFRSTALAGITVTLAPDSLSLGSSESATVVATVFDGGSPLAGESVSFSSGDPGVATVTAMGTTDASGRASGTVEAVGKGETAVEASIQGSTARSEVEVVPGASLVSLSLGLLLALLFLWRRDQTLAAR